MKTPRSLAALPAAVLAIALLPGCGREEVEPLNPGERRIVQRSAEGGAELDVEMVGEGALPTDFPSDLPTYPGASASGALSIPGAGQFVTFTSQAAVEDVVGFYRTKLVGSGWRVVSESEQPPAIVATKGGRQVYIRIEAAGRLTRIGVSLEASSS